MLTVATACDKKEAVARRLASRPTVLFHVFGSAEDPRVIPVAFLDSGGPRTMDLSPDEWRTFDSLYTRGGDSLTIYSQGRVVGSARVQRGMWEGPAPLYTLPGCRSPLPQASVRVAVDAPTGSVVEFLATSAPLRSDTTLTSRPMALSPLAVTGLARELAAREAQAAGIPEAALDSLDYRALAANTGSTRAPTLVASFVDPTGDDAGGREVVRHIFVVADLVNGAWTPTYRSVHAKTTREDALRRYVDRLDLTGDGVAEIVLDEWTLGGGSRPLVLRWKGGKWEEAWRGKPDWCVEK